MANKEHNTITDPEIHEPKDASTALIGQVYTSDGAGSGSWSVPSGNNTVIVNAKADFPTPSGGVITLLANTTYVLGAAISVGTDRFALGANTSVTGNSLHSTLTYTGTGIMFTGVDVSASMIRVSLNCANGTVYSLTDNTGGVNQFIGETVIVDSCAAWGTFDDLLLTQFLNSSCLNATQGITILGTNGLIWSFDRFALVSTSASFVGINLGTATASNIEFNNLVLVGPSGAAGISGAAGNANVPTGVIATVSNSDFSGGMTTPLVGITEDDIRWSFKANSANVRDTLPDSLLALNGNTTDSVISVQSTAVLVGGTWTDERSSHFTNTTGGRSTYDGEKDLLTPFSVHCTVDVASGSNKVVTVYLAKNGTVYTNTGLALTVSAGAPLPISTQWQDSLTETDYIEVWVANETDTVNVIVTDAILRLR